MSDGDFQIENHGSVVLLRGITPEAEEWIEERVGDEDTQYFGNAVVIEPRYIGPIIEAMVNEGFEWVTS